MLVLPTRRYLEAITEHTRGLAEAARGRLDRPVEHCPGWSVADLVHHVSDVQWFWRTIVAERLDTPPDEARRPARVLDDELVDRLLTGVEQLVAVLAGARQDDACWTWAPGHHDVAFVTRHQVQEAAVHHHDAVHAASGRGTWSLDEDLAGDAVEEFLTVSVSSVADPADPPRPALAGALWICPCYDELDLPTWYLADDVPGTLRWWRHAPSGPELTQAAVAGTHTHAHLALLWLYGRVSDGDFFSDALDGAERNLVARFRALTYT